MVLPRTSKHTRISKRLGLFVARRQSYKKTSKEKFWTRRVGDQMLLGVENVTRFERYDEVSLSNASMLKMIYSRLCVLVMGAMRPSML